MKKLTLLFCIVFISSLYISCGDDDGNGNGDEDDNTEELTDPATGQVAGEAWTFKVGFAREDANDGRVTFELQGQDAPEGGDICDSFLTNRARINFTIPSAAEGTYTQPRENAETVLFRGATASDSEFATEGSVVISSIGETTISGTINASADAGNTVIGQFVVEKCF